MKKILFSSVLAALVSLPAFAHTALMSCIDNGDNTVLARRDLATAVALAAWSLKCFKMARLS